MIQCIFSLECIDYYILCTIVPAILYLYFNYDVNYTLTNCCTVSDDRVRFLGHPRGIWRTLAGGRGKPLEYRKKKKRDYSPYSLSDNPCLSVYIIYYSSVIVYGDREWPSMGVNHRGSGDEGVVWGMKRLGLRLYYNSLRIISQGCSIVMEL